MLRVVSVLLVVFFAGCASGSLAEDAAVGGDGDGEPDARRSTFPDAATNAPDARPSSPDARPGAPDSAVNAPDAMPPAADAMPPDADLTADADPNEVVFASAEIGTADAQGFNASSLIWLSWRFEVTAAVTTHSVGFYANDGTGTLFAAIVALTDENDVPDELDLTGSDLVSPPTVFTVRTTEGEVRVPMTESLAPGWYAVVFGSGAFTADGSVRVTRGHTPILGADTSFRMQQPSGPLTEGTHSDMRFYVKAILD